MWLLYGELQVNASGEPWAEVNRVERMWNQTNLPCPWNNDYNYHHNNKPDYSHQCNNNNNNNSYSSNDNNTHYHYDTQTKYLYYLFIHIFTISYFVLCSFNKVN